MDRFENPSLVGARSRREGDARSPFLRSQQRVMAGAVAGGVVFRGGEAGVLNQQGIFVPLREKDQTRKYIRGYVAPSKHFDVQNLHKKNVSKMEANRPGRNDFIFALARTIIVLVSSFSPVDAEMKLNKDFLLFVGPILGSIFSRGKNYGMTPITESAKRFNLR